jgi:hypothetical protein
MFYNEQPKLDQFFGIRVSQETHLTLQSLPWPKRKQMRREIRKILEKYSTLPVPTQAAPKSCDTS